MWYAAALEHRPVWLRVDRLLGEHGIGEDSAAGREEFARRMEGQLGEHHAGDLRREEFEGRAERIVAEELQRLGWTESDLIGQPKRATGKLAIAARLRRETTMPLNRIAARVRLGTSKGANSSLHRWMKANPKPNAEAIIGAGGTNTASITNQSMG